MQSGSIRSRPRPAPDTLQCTDRGPSGAPLHQFFRPQTSRRSHRVSTRSIRSSGGLPAAISAAARWSTRSPSLAQTIRRRRSPSPPIKESRRLWFRERLVELGIACDTASASGRWLDRWQPRARRSHHGVRGKGGGQGAAEECGGCSRLTSATSPVQAAVASRADQQQAGTQQMIAR